MATPPNKSRSHWFSWFSWFCHDQEATESNRYQTVSDLALRAENLEKKIITVKEELCHVAQEIIAYEEKLHHAAKEMKEQIDVG
jgi:hypothetical protein